MGEEDRTTAFGLWRYALEYLAAARTLADAETQLRRIVIHTDVTYQCACQGLELAFKAFLRAGGATVDDLRGIGHPITKAMTRAFDLGLTKLNPSHLAAINLVDRLYAAHEFRYIVTGSKEYPTLTTLLEAGASALMAIAPAVSKATTGDESLVPRMRQDATEIMASRL